MRIGRIAAQRRQATRRRALKRWLHSHGETISERERYDESALRKRVRDAAPGGDA